MQPMNFRKDTESILYSRCNCMNEKQVFPLDKVGKDLPGRGANGQRHRLEEEWDISNDYGKFVVILGQ